MGAEPMKAAAARMRKAASLKEKAMIAIPVAAGALGAAGAAGGAYLSMGEKGRKRVSKEVRDPRLYSNIRGAFGSKEDRIAAHKKLKRGKHTVLSAMKEGFTRGSGREGKKEKTSSIQEERFRKHAHIMLIKQARAKMEAGEELTELEKEAFMGAALKGLTSAGKFLGQAGKAGVAVAGKKGVGAGLQHAGKMGLEGTRQAGKWVAKNPKAGLALGGGALLGAGGLGYAAG